MKKLKAQLHNTIDTTTQNTFEYWCFAISEQPVYLHNTAC